MSDEQQQEETPVQDYSQESLEELEKRLRDGEGLIIEREDEEPESAEPEPEPDVPPAAESEEPETEGAESPEVEEPVAGEEPEFDEQGMLVEELKLELERARAQSERDQVLQQRDSGRVGALNKELKKLQQILQQQQAQPQPVDPYDEPQMRQPQPPPSVPGIDAESQSRLVALEQDARARAVDEVANEFIQGHGLSMDEGMALIKELGPSLQEQAAPYNEEFQTMQPNSMKKVLRVMLNSAYADHRLAEIKTRREEALAKRASQVPEKKQAKTAAAISGSGGTPAPKSVAKSADGMTAEEADKALIREFGDGHYRRRRA
jgi:hypothetical protein